MIDKTSATLIAREYLNAEAKNWTFTPVLLEDFTEESESVWVFYYNNEEYVRTKDSKYALAGNGPILVDKLDGSLHRCGRAFAPEEYARKYDAIRKSGRAVDIDDIQQTLIRESR